MNNSIPSDEVYKEMIIKFLQGQLRATEEASLLLWINQSKENEAIFLDYRDIWLQASLQKSDKQIFDSELAWANFNKASAGKDSKQINWLFVSKIAALMVLVFSLGATSTLFFKPSQSNSDNQLCEIVTPLGAKSQVTLPDGSTVWLNAGSRLTYRKDFNEATRHVSLEGEAFFKVTTNKKKPFVVNASGINVKAYGTSFNVKAYAIDKSVVATLVEGIIKVEGKGADKKDFSYTLKPNQNITYVKDTKTLQTKDISEVVPDVAKEELEVVAEKIRKESVIVNNDIRAEVLTSWKESRWLIEGEKLGSLATMFERRYNVVVHFKSDELRNFKFSGTIENETLEQVLGILRLTTPLKYEIGKGEIWWDIDTKLADKYSRILTKKGQ